MSQKPSAPLTCEETGRAGGYARAAALSPARRKQIAKLGAAARIKNQRAANQKAKRAAAGAK